MPFVTVHDLEMYYEIHGKGPRLLVINGTGGDLRRKPNVFDMPLISDFEILCYDQRDMGQTSGTDSPYTMADYAGDADALLQALGWDSCRVMGISFGGMVAQEFAIRYPKRVERLVLACTSSGGEGGASYPLHELSDLPVADYIHRILTLGDTRRDEAWKIANPEKYQALFDETLAGIKVGSDEPGRAEGVRKQLEARVDHDTYTRLPQIEMPVYICGGRYDGIAPPDNLTAIQQQIQKARMELFEGGHLFIIQDRMAFKNINNFLSS